MNQDKRRDQNEGDKRVRSGSETVDEPQPAAGKDEYVNRHEQHKLDGVIDAP